LFCIYINSMCFWWFCLLFFKFSFLDHIPECLLCYSRSKRRYTCFSLLL
jgi:hypothetical protein